MAIDFIAELVLIVQMLFSFVFHVHLQIWGLSENRWLQNLINPYCHNIKVATSGVVRDKHAQIYYSIHIKHIFI